MLAAFLLGLIGSFGHCVGMCSGVMLLIQRGNTGSSMVPVHMGRISSYTALGLIVGTLGAGTTLAHATHAHQGNSIWPWMNLLQGALALLVAVLAAYLMLALLGRAPSPELLLAHQTVRWGRAMRRIAPKGHQGHMGLYIAGVLWGLLPCGMVLTALLTALVAGSPWNGALTMLAFGLGTLPALLGVGWLSRHGLAKPAIWPRHAAALLVGLFGVQTALRGLASWGWVDHLYMGSLMLW